MPVIEMQAKWSRQRLRHAIGSFYGSKYSGHQTKIFR